MKKRPELLIGTFGYENVVEVLENQETILDYVSQSAQLLDIGMIRLASIVNKQSRQLTQREKNDILSHPCEGAKFVEEIPALCKYRDAVLGHHKSSISKYLEESARSLSKYMAPFFPSSSLKGRL